MRLKKEKKNRQQSHNLGINSLSNPYQDKSKATATYSAITNKRRNVQKETKRHQKEELNSDNKRISDLFQISGPLQTPILYARRKWEGHGFHNIYSEGKRKK